MTLVYLCCYFSPLLPLPCNSYSTKHHHNCFLLSTKKTFLTFPVSKNFSAAANSQVSSSSEDEKLDSELLDYELLSRVSSAKDAGEVLILIAEERRKNGGVVGTSDCGLIISAALDRGNAELALSVFSAMRSTFDSGMYGLAESLRVADALRMIDYVCRVGVSPGEEVPFGKVVRCPNCFIAVAVAQPQQGIQACSIINLTRVFNPIVVDIYALQHLLTWAPKYCRLYPAQSAATRSPPAERSMDVPAWKRGLQFLQIMKQNIPAAVHSIVVETPSGMARTHRFATDTVDLPAQEGERVTIAVAAPMSVYREVGPLKLSSRIPNFYPGEPMCLTNHRDGRESRLLRAPSKDGGTSILKPSILFPMLAIFASGDAASGILDPSLPQLISVAAVSSLAVGVTFNNLPQRLVDITSIRQQLLSQYDVLQSRIKELKKAAENETNLYLLKVWMLARMCQLENKIYAVGEPSYRARRSRVKRVRESLESSLKNRIELIESYARISSMIEIEVELDLDVLAAEAVSSTKWRIQAEANDEAERLLSSEPDVPTQRTVDERAQLRDMLEYETSFYLLKSKQLL
ncbi:hypothetical protein ACJIZ3_001875 [Penstemon smallii]|uniref:Uncharacterized protein n=1 Tax=Penstemon smallii TaxID=265156 RepID=A0ABD3U4Y0_9LAMI